MTPELRKLLKEYSEYIKNKLKTQAPKSKVIKPYYN